MKTVEQLITALSQDGKIFINDCQTLEKVETILDGLQVSYYTFSLGNKMMIELNNVE